MLIESGADLFSFPSLSHLFRQIVTRCCRRSAAFQRIFPTLHIPFVFIAQLIKRNDQCHISTHRFQWFFRFEFFFGFHFHFHLLMLQSTSNVAFILIFRLVLSLHVLIMWPPHFFRKKSVCVCVVCKTTIYAHFVLPKRHLLFTWFYVFLLHSSFHSKSTEEKKNYTEKKRKKKINQITNHERAHSVRI